MKYNYCPFCGKKLLLQESFGGEMIPYCDECKKNFRDSFRTCVLVAVVNQNKEIAVLTQNYITKDHKVLVSGMMECGEVPEDTVSREVLEELGINVDSIRYCKSYFMLQKDFLMLGFLAQTNDKKFKISNEVDDAVWVNIYDSLSLLGKGSLVEDLAKYIIDNNLLK